ncbi:MAG: ATP-dependent DNA helicase RecG [Alphaproteobacteria bacterium]|nr:ATP-dependent DNA helicase RecG [Alphaproteobacteria bacterium]
MRPQILFSLFAPFLSLPGIGPKLAPLVARAVGGEKIVDLLWHRPTGLVDRRATPKIAAAADGAIATIVVTVDQHVAPRTRQLPYKVRCRDETGFLNLVFFHAKADWLAKQLPIGAQRVVSGRIERYRDEIQITHPDHVVPVEEMASVAIVEPTYALTTGVTARVMARTVRAAVDRAPDLPEWLDAALMAREAWPSWRAAIRALHGPASVAELSPTTVARRRLAYDELLANQLALLLVRRHQRRQLGTPLTGDGSLRRRLLEALPFALTGAQRRAIDEIVADLALPQRMLRLVQGDVGSGKTVVALMAMLVAAEAGRQGALMAPTEILARQHYETIRPLAERIGVEVGLLTGRDKPRERRAMGERLARGELKLVVGTHALFQDDVEFADLALAVIDEQHRFGVHQRLALAEKGTGVHVLVTTATPIPRTLMLCAYGDMDSSRLDEKPPGRKPVDTRLVPLDRLDEVGSAIGRRISNGDKIFWVCPLVEESEAVDLAAATERQLWLAHQFGEERVALVHGKLKPAEKDAAMTRFVDGDAAILVATTVIEVGVDVPAATVMVVEHAERFGLAQLHQLRGRVGRGQKPATCLLLYQTPPGETAAARLRIMRETDDGFRIAEEDLRLRGAGELLGTRQSGLPEFRLADISVHGDLLAIARDEAKLIIERDDGLSGERGAALRTLLYLFERDGAVALFRSG